jgi:hypothetical protein
MPTERLSMRHIREVLHLHYAVGMSQRAVSRSLGLAQGTVSKYLNRTRRAGLTWPLPPELDDDVRLESRLYPPPSDLQGFRSAIGILSLVKRYGQSASTPLAPVPSCSMPARTNRSPQFSKTVPTKRLLPPPRRPSSSTPTSAAPATTIDQEIIMLIHPTVERLRSLGLAAMAETLVELQNHPDAAEMPHADWLGLLIDREVTSRDNRRLSRRLTTAKLRQAATIENVDYRTARGLDRSLFQSLATSQWIRDCNHLAVNRLSNLALTQFWCSAVYSAPISLA